MRVRTAEEIERRCGSSTHQGICAEAGGYPYVGADEMLAREEPLIVVLDQIQDPHNLGSICRSAECVGATGVVIPERRSAEVTPTVCKTSAGAVEHLRYRARPQRRRLPSRGARGGLLVLRRERRATAPCSYDSARLQRRRRAGARQRGLGPAPAGGRGVRSAGLAAAARAASSRSASRPLRRRFCTGSCKSREASLDKAP